MPKRFFITGLPRSRTAWMAAFMTSGNAVCLHEPRNWAAMWNHDGAQHVGISDSGLGFRQFCYIFQYIKIINLCKYINIFHNKKQILNKNLHIY